MAEICKRTQRINRNAYSLLLASVIKVQIKISAQDLMENKKKSVVSPYGENRNVAQKGSYQQCLCFRLLFFIGSSLGRNTFNGKSFMQLFSVSNSISKHSLSTTVLA
jgi:hypothetical protein